MDIGPEVADWSYDEQGNRERVAALRRAGVVVWGAERVFIGPEVATDRIEPGAVLMNAVIRGPETAIGAQSKVGISGTSLLVNSQVGREVELGAGSYRNTTLFDRVKIRDFAEMRKGTVLEEEAEVGHNVGLKHTFFTVGVVAGSCINFCDVLVTGGSSRHDHSEIGSGAIHFNFDPHGDKFGSLIGDATGLLLRGRRIFIGGNGGVIAPVHIGFGAVSADSNHAALDRSDRTEKFECLCVIPFQRTIALCMRV
jgi:UDP-N-acetylglucosamine/UDP-N-acetylgalactosamine diphosphorylase